jgi:hypothetical protein
MAIPEKKPTKEEKLNEIIDDIFLLNSPKIDDSRKKQISEFIKGAVNGDNPIDRLVLNANLDENIQGVIAYILTNLRLIKIDISSNDIQSKSFPLSTIIGIERKLVDGIAQFSVSFQNGSFGLRYSPSEHKITDFFQKIDHTRNSGG